MQGDTDVVVIGAGAAGIAGGRRLAAAGVRALVLEARGRIGGRAFTRADGVPAPIDLGAEWFHSADRNPLVALARGLGLTVDETAPNWGGHDGSGFSEVERAEFHAASARFWTALHEAADGPDRPAAELLEPGCRWNGLIQAVSTWYNGVELERVSTADLGRYEDTRVNWRLREGYGALVARAGAELPIALDCPALTVDHAGPGVRVETARGAFGAKACIVTVPVSLIADGSLRFFPDLPEKRAAAARLPLGLADKIFFEIERPTDLPAGAHLFGALDREAVSFEIRPRGAPLVAGFVGGAFARALEAAGQAAAEAEARRQLADMLGARSLPRLRFIAATQWDRDPFARGAYSHALPGAGDARSILAAPVAEKLFFAGEACSANRFSTVHGAWETGEAAADLALAALKRPNVIM